MNNNGHNNGFTSGVVIGTALGVAGTFLVATKTGRKILKKIQENGFENVADLVGIITDEFSDTAPEIHTKTTHMSRHVEEPIEVVTPHAAPPKKRFFRGIKR